MEREGEADAGGLREVSVRGGVEEVAGGKGFPIGHDEGAEVAVFGDDRAPGLPEHGDAGFCEHGGERAIAHPRFQGDQLHLRLLQELAEEAVVGRLARREQVAGVAIDEAEAVFGE
ncbi:hypothetical protein D3C87_1251620 [compost metagenome]